jgi:hypothetical protein
VQVDPIKPVLKEPGTKHLNAKYDKLLSNAAFKFNLRRYNPARRRWALSLRYGLPDVAPDYAFEPSFPELDCNS